MSASKLEKNVVNLERRLREDFRLELERALRPCLERLDVLEAGNHLSDQKVVQLELDHNPPQAAIFVCVTVLYSRPKSLLVF